MACFVVLSLCGLGLTPGGEVGAQTLTHTVRSGDTLWDICETYYGDADLWPKLWQMNPFITNPHLLKPGDVITLLEGMPPKPEPILEKKTSPAVRPVGASVTNLRGIDVSGFTDVRAAGFLSTKEVDPWGYIFSSERERVALAEGEVVHVNLKSGREVKVGDQFAICDISPLLHHPLTGERLGYVSSFLGRLTIMDQVKEHLYKAEITESYKGIFLGNPILPYEPLSACVQPSLPERPLTTNIVATKDQLEIIGQYTVVYLDKGYSDGVRRGNLFQILKRMEIQEKGSVTVLPDIVMGHLVILETWPDTSTAVVLDSVEEMANGAWTSSLDWEKEGGSLTFIPKCTLQ